MQRSTRGRCDSVVGLAGAVLRERRHTAGQTPRGRAHMRDPNTQLTEECVRLATWGEGRKRSKGQTSSDQMDKFWVTAADSMMSPSLTLGTAGRPWGRS